MSTRLGKPPTDDEGHTIVAPAFEATEGLHPLWHGHLYTCTAGATNIFDELVVNEKKLRGGWYTLMDGNAVVGDFIEEAVVDKDDVLGYFGYYGYTVGVDVLELKKYVRTEYVHPKSEGFRQEFQAGSVFGVVAGLYTRTIYESTGLVDVKLAVTPFGYE
jgi:hypothetical protein